LLQIRANVTDNHNDERQKNVSVPLICGATFQIKGCIADYKSVISRGVEIIKVEFCLSQPNFFLFTLPEIKYLIT